MRHTYNHSAASCVHSPPLVAGLQYLPPPSDRSLHENASRVATEAYQAFADSFCGLPVANSSSPTQHHWRNTVGKFYIGWMWALFRSASAHARYVIPRKVLSERYIFPPGHESCPLIDADVCASRARGWRRGAGSGARWPTPIASPQPRNQGPRDAASARAIVGNAWSKAGILSITRMLADMPTAAGGRYVACEASLKLLHHSYVQAGRFLRLALEARSSSCAKRTLMHHATFGGKLRQGHSVAVAAAASTAPTTASTATSGRAMPSVSAVTPARLSIAMHVRRGDACERFVPDSDARAPGGTMSAGGGITTDQPTSTATTTVASVRTAAALRPCASLSAYMRSVRELRRRYGASHVLVATDSEAVIEELKDYTVEGFSFGFVMMNRTAVGGLENASLGGGATAQANLIENRHGVDRTYLFDSVHADIELLTGAHMFVGSDSASSRLLLLALIGRLGTVPPFVIVDPTVPNVKGGGACLGCVTCFEGERLPHELTCIREDPMHAFSTTS